MSIYSSLSLSLSLSLSRRRLLTSSQAGFSAIGLALSITALLAGVMVGILLFSPRPTQDDLQRLQTQVSGLEQKATQGALSSDDRAALTNLKQGIDELRTADQDQTQIAVVVQRIEKLEATGGSLGPRGESGSAGAIGAIGAAGASGVQGLQGPPGAQGIQGVPGSNDCLNGVCVSRQSGAPGVAEAGNINISGLIIAASFQGNGANLTGVDASYLSGFNAGYFTNASNLISGTIADARLSAAVSLLGQTIGLADLESDSVNSSKIVNGSVANIDLVNPGFTITAGSGLSGGGSVVLGGSVTLANAGVVAVTGTANQITVSGATGSVTFSLPQDIAVTSSPTFAGLTLSGSATVAGSVTAGSYARSCPTGYVPVPGNPKFGTSDFCVMQYEARDDGAGNAVSTYTGYPWINISQRTAQDKSQAAGGHLISEAEWMTIATNAMQQPANWCNANGGGCGNPPGTGGKPLAAGHNDNAPAQALTASSNVADACFGTVTDGVNTPCGSAGTQKRTLTLSNGSVLWDVAGNVWEWTDGWVNQNEEPSVDTVTDGTANYREYTVVNQYKGLQYLNPTNRGWNSAQGLGTIYSYSNSTATAQIGFLRGGSWLNGSDAGAFALYLGYTPTSANTNFGFRVAR